MSDDQRTSGPAATARGGGGTSRGVAGQATVELVLVLPVIVLAMLLVIQVAVVARQQVLVVEAARAGARSAAVEGLDAAGPAARATPGFRAGDLDIDASYRPGPDRGRLVRVRVRARVPTDVALVGPLVGDPTVAAVVTMRVEDPLEPVPP